MPDFQDPERPGRGNPRRQFERTLAAGQKSLETQLARLTQPVADDRFTLPTETRLSLFFEMLDEIAARYAGDALIEALTTQTRNAAADLVGILQAFNAGKGPECLEGVATLRQRIDDIESKEIGGLPTLDAFLDEKGIEEIARDFDSPRSKTLQNLIHARSGYLLTGMVILLHGRTPHERFTNLASALERVMTAIEATPSRLEQESTRERAGQNILQFIEDLALPGITHTSTGKCRTGRYEFKLKNGRYQCTVAMPGLALEEVRPPDTKATPESLRHLCRLLVDDSSWIWEIALKIVRDTLQGSRSE